MKLVFNIAIVVLSALACLTASKYRPEGTNIRRELARATKRLLIDNTCLDHDAFVKLKGIAITTIWDLSDATQELIGVVYQDGFSSISNVWLSHFVTQKSSMLSQNVWNNIVPGFMDFCDEQDDEDLGQLVEIASTFTEHSFVFASFLEKKVKAGPALTNTNNREVQKLKTFIEMDVKFYCEVREYLETYSPSLLHAVQGQFDSEVVRLNEFVALIPGNNNKLLGCLA